MNRTKLDVPPQTAGEGRPARKRRVPASVPALTPADSLSMLRSAVGYVMQSGLQVRAKNLDGGRLLIVVTGAAVDYSQDGGKFVPADVPAQAEGVPASVPPDVPAREK